MHTKYPAVALYVMPQSFWTTGVDEVIRMEDLQSSNNWNELMDKCGIKEDIVRPHENKTHSDLHRARSSETLVHVEGVGYKSPLYHKPAPYPSYEQDYREAYTEYMRSQIYNIFTEEITTYGYEF